jgi:dTDP-4-dehydrorhamnose reductase
MSDNQKVLVTGALGMLGADLVQALENTERFDVIKTDVDDMDITNVAAVRDLMLAEKPDIVCHLAAFTDVDGAESKRLECWRVNVEGTMNIAIFCRELNAQMIYISTDYVFDGNAADSYLEHDLTKPINFYGESKLAGEQNAQALVEKIKIVRTSWLCGHGGSGKNFVETILKLAERESELSIVTDQVGHPTFTFDLADAIIQLIGVEEYGVFHVTNRGKCSWYDFAAEILKQAGLEDVPLRAITSDQLRQRPANRPAFSALENTRFDKIGLASLPLWEKSLKRYLQIRKK